MDVARWHTIDRLFQLAIEHPEDERPGWLDAACVGDPELRRAVETLLRVDRERVSLLDAGVAASCADLAPVIAEGDRVGPYAIGRRLGEGGMSVVHLAERADGRFDRQVAIKFLRQAPFSREAMGRFLLEIEILGRLEHRHTARLYDAGATDRGVPYIVMEHVDGERIDRYCARHGLALAAKLELLRGVCEAVADAHRRLIVHRDLKPSNVLVTGGVPKLLDFGIAKLLAREPGPDRGSLTGTGWQPMTPQFASPEQLRSEPITTATDVYSLGMILFLLLSGRLPYDVDELSAAELDRLRQGRLEVPRPSQVAASGGRALSGDLDTVVLKAMAMEPAHRYPSVEQLAEDLDRFRAGLPVRAQPPTWLYRARKLFARHRLAIAVSGVGATAILAFAVTMAWLAGALAVERDRAQIEAATSQEVIGFMVGLFEASQPGAPRDRELTVREVLDRAAERIRGELGGQPRVRSALLDALGAAYLAQSRFDESVPLLESALELERRAGTASSGLAPILLRLSSAELERSRLDRAEELAREALAILAEEPESGDRVAAAESHLGTILVARGDLEGGGALMRRALDRRLRRHGSEHPSVGESYYELSRLAFERRDMPEMERWCRQALAILARARGAENPLTISVRQDLALALQDQGKLPEALGTYSEILQLQRRVYGERHREVAVTLNALATTHYDLGDYPAAESHLRSSLEMLRALSGEDTADVARLLNNLGKMVERQGRTAEAAELYAEALDILRARLDPGAPALGLPMIYLAEAWSRTGRAAEAEPLVREAIAVLAKALGEGHYRVALARAALGSCLVRLGRYEEAETQLLAGRQTIRAQLGEGHRHTAYAARRLEELYSAWGKPPPAEGTEPPGRR